MKINKMIFKYRFQLKTKSLSELISLKASFFEVCAKHALPYGATRAFMCVSTASSGLQHVGNLHIR